MWDWTGQLEAAARLGIPEISNSNHLSKAPESHGPCKQSLRQMNPNAAGVIAEWEEEI